MTSVANVATPGGAGGSRDWARRYPPLAALVVALMLAVAVLPSALNLPQSNPSTTLEYAPVPPADEDEPPPQTGNLSSLGLASTGGVGEGEGEGPGMPELEPLEGPPGGLGKSPRTKRCVGNPPKQTEDPLAPPCVADFRGDNFGTTYQGVNGEEVRILFYIQGFSNYVNLCRDPGRVTPDNEYFDLAEPGDEDEHCLLRVLRNWQRYFNERFQTYNRFVHFYVYVSGEGDSPEIRRADAADNYAKIKPFAVISTANSYSDAYLETMAKRGVLNFDALAGRPAEFFRRFPKLVWGYFPSLEITAKQYAGYVCRKVQPHPVSSVTGNRNDVGKPRVYGLWSTSDKTRPELQLLAAEVERQVKQCGVTFKVKRTFPSAGYVADSRYSPRYASEAVAEYVANGVTTIIWPGGLETNLSKQAANAGYLPEVIALGDQRFETDTHGGFQDQTFWNHVRMITNILREPPDREQMCFKAYREVDPEADLNETRLACRFYNGIRQLFTGIQVAGPRLTPSTMDAGYHAIPRIKSTSPFVPACFYDPGDYTCVKDAVVERWDSSATEQQDNGCYRMVEGGQRYFAEVWPEGNIDAQDKPDDPCNEYDGSFLINPSTPDDPQNF